MARLFLSYARDDDDSAGLDDARSFVRRLYRDLTALGHEVWFDRLSMPHRGLEFSTEIARAIEAADRLLLVVGPAALASKYVTDEWRHALRCGRPVHALLRRDDIGHLPPEIQGYDARDFQHDAHYDRELHRLHEQLRDTLAPAGPIFGDVRPLSPHFLGRDDELALLRSLAVTSLGAVGVTGTGFGAHGAGGRGKTELAAHLVYDWEVRRTFPDGLLWLSLTEDLTPQGLVELQQTVIGWLGGDTSFTDANVGRARLSTLLRDRACLLVLDNAWTTEQCRAFAGDCLGPRCRALITTRNAGVLKDLGVEPLRLDRLAAGDALALSARWNGLAPEHLPEDAHAVIAWAQGEPHALEILARAVYKIGGEWSAVLEQIRLPWNGPDAQDPRTIFLRAIDVSVRFLPEPHRARYLQLALLFRGDRVPPEVPALLWKAGGATRFQALDTLAQLEDRALLSRDAGGRVLLHDHNVDYLLWTAAETLPALHAQLVETYRKRHPAGWHTGDPEDDYYWSRLPRHLHEAGRAEELRALLLDFRWLQAKLLHSGVLPLREDFALLPEGPAVSLTLRALDLSAHVLAKEPRQLASQLLGRLAGDPTPGVDELLASAREHAPRPWLRPVTASLTPPGALLRTLEGHTDRIIAVAVTPDGRRAVSASGDETLRVWDLASGALLHTLQGHADVVSAVAVTPDGRRAVSTSDDHTLKVWDLASGALLYSLQGHTEAVDAVVVTPDGHRGVSASKDHTLKVWDLASGALLHTLRGHTGGVLAVAVTPGGHRAVSASDDHTLKVWDLASGALLYSLQGHTRGVEAVAVTSDGHRTVSASGDGTLRVWDLTSGALLHSLHGHTDWVRAVAVTPDGHRAVSASWDRTLKVWDLASGALLHSFHGHTEALEAVAVTPDGHRAVSASWDHTLKVWDLASGALLHSLRGHTDWVRAIAVTPDGHRAVSASKDYTLRVWDLSPGALFHDLPGHTDWVRAVAATPDGHRAISASDDHTLKVWERTSGALLHSLQGHTGWVRAVAVTPDGHRAVSASDDHTLKVWDLTSGALLHTLRGHTGGVLAVAVAPDGRCAVSASWDHTLKVWDLASGAILHDLRGHTGGVLAIAITPDGRHAISASEDRKLKVWDLTSGALLPTLPSHNLQVKAVSVTRDGHRAVSVCDDHTLKVWDLSSGALLHTLPGHTDWVLAVALAPNGHRAVSASWDHTLRVWDLTAGVLVAGHHADAPIPACAVALDGVTVVAADSLGRMHFLRLEE